MIHNNKYYYYIYVDDNMKYKNCKFYRDGDCLKNGTAVEIIVINHNIYNSLMYIPYSNNNIIQIQKLIESIKTAASGKKVTDNNHMYILLLLYYIV